MAVNPQTTDIIVALLVLFVVYVFYVVARYVLALVQNFQLAAQFPSAPYHWLYGNMHLTEGYYGEKYLSLTRERTRKHPKASALWLTGFFGKINVTHPQTIKELMKTSTSKSSDYEPIRPWLGNGLLLSDGEVWKVHRRLLTPAFHFGVLKQYMSVYNAEASKMIDRLSSYAEKGESFEMFQEANMATMEVLLQCAFSGGTMSEVQKTEYVSSARRISELFIEREFNPIYLIFDSIYNLSAGGREFKRLCDFVHDVAEAIIKLRRQELESSDNVLPQKKKLDFIDILLRARDEDGRGLTDLEIREEVDNFLFAGHETTASTLSWTLYSLAQHPEHQEKVREEVEQVFTGRTADTVEMEDLPNLPYLAQCVKEAMRLYAPVPFISRTTKEDTVIDGIHIPKGSYVGIHLYALNHNPEVWGPDHMEFDPTRFHPDRMRDMDSHAFIPFSAGQRNCIGQNFAMNEEKVLLARLLREFKFELEPSRPVRKNMLFTMMTKDGMWLNVRPVHR